MKRVLTGLSIVLGLVHSALAQEAERGATMDNVQAQLSVCIAYYSLEMECTEGGSAARFLHLLVKRSDAAAKALAMSRADVAMRLKFNLAMQRSLIEDSCANIARLRSRHEEDCEPWLRKGASE